MRKTHGMGKTSEYSIWSMMKDRCVNPNSTAFSYYGGRGIRVCDRWLESFENFFEDMGKRPSKKHQLDRIDNDGDYSPENCQWRTVKQQHRNKRNNVWIEFDGKKKILSDWAREYGLAPKVLHGRISLGWSMERALTEPVGQYFGGSK